LEVSLWAPDPDEGAKLVSFYNQRNEAPLVIQMEATMLFAMDEASQVDRGKIAPRQFESGNLLVSIRNQQGGVLIGVLILSGTEAIRQLSIGKSIELAEHLAVRLAPEPTGAAAA